MASEALVVPKWLEIAEKELGEHEIPGDKSNPRIIEYHKATTLKSSSDEVPWCSSFVCWVMQEAGFKTTRSASARSWQWWGKEIKKPEFGCIVVFKRGSSPSQGHVGFFVGQGSDHIKILGGNQGDQVSIANFNKDKVVAYRWPKEIK